MSDAKHLSIGESKESLHSNNLWLTMRKTLTPREKFLVFLSIILFVTSVVFLSLFVAFYTRYEDAKGGAAALEGVCQTFDCLESAAYIAKSINTNVDPCEDFYQFACGRWVEEHPIPAGTSEINNFYIVDDEIKLFLQDLLIVNDSAAPEAVKQARAYFRSCEDIDTINNRGKKPLLDLLNLTAGGMYPTLQPHWTDTGMTFSDIVEYLTTVGDLGSNTFISMKVDEDEMNSDRNIITFTQTDLVLSVRGLYIEERNSTAMKLLEIMYRQVLEALGANATTAAQDAKDVVDFEIQLAQATEPREKVIDRVNQYHRMTLADMTVRFPQFIWLGYVQSQFSQSGLNCNITLDEVVANDALTYYTNLFQLVNQTSVRKLLNYGMWRLVHKFLNFLDPSFQKIQILRLPERWKTCVKYTESLFPYAVGRLYVDKKFSSQDKRRMEHMIEKLTVAFKEMLLEVTWMTQPTREEALKKLNFIVNKIGYPDFILNDTALNAKSEMYTVDKNNFFENNLEVIKKTRLSMLKKLRKPVDRTEWLQSPSTVNAYHLFLRNEIVFPAGILSPPFYSKKISDALIFGSIGFIIGHEITHGFDNLGSTFDEKGNLHQWWQEEDFEIFRNRTQCLVEQYSQFVDKELNMHVNGQLTLGENIADNGGIKEAFRAYRSVIKERGREEDKYPSLPYTQDQLFFIGFAQTWCNNNSPIFRKISLLSALHSPQNFRVIGSLQNSVDFEQVFNCPVGTPMNPRHKCQVW